MIYCQTCGASNDPSQNYCLNDGTKLQKDTHIKVSRQSGEFCATCGTKADANHNYCQTCGSSFFTRKEGGAGIAEILKPVAAPIAKPVAGTRVSGSKSSGDFMAKAIAVAFVAFVVLFLVTAVKGSSFPEAFETALMEEVLGEVPVSEEVAEEYFSDIDIFSPSSILLFNHLLPMVFTMELYHDSEEHSSIRYFDEGATGSIALTFSLLSNLLIPVLVVLVAGVVLGKSIGRDQRVGASIVFAGVYGLLLSAVSLFAKNSIENAGAELGIDFSFEFSYPLIGAIINGFAIAFLFSWAGMKLVHSFSGKREESLFAVAAGKAFSGVAAGLAVAVVCAVIGLSNIDQYPILNMDLDELEEEGVDLKMPLSVQGGAYLFGLSNFGEFGMEYGESESEEQSRHFSLLGGVKDEDGNVPENEETTFMAEESMDKVIIAAWCLLVALAAFFIWSGIQISKRFGFQFPPLLVFSVVYAALSTIIQAAAQIGIDVEMASASLEITMGMESLSIFFTSFLFAAVFTIVGGLLQGKKA